MQRFLVGLGIIAALAFLAVSATANALFLASLGQSPLAIGLLAVLSVAADIAKGVLPVVVTRCTGLRKWGQAALASAFLATTIALSLTSGFGFAAMTRGASTVERQTAATKLAAREARLVEVERELRRLTGRPASVIAVELEAALVDRRWAATKSCGEVQGKDARQFCAVVLGLRKEQAVAAEREQRHALRAALGAEIEALQSGAAHAPVDPQVAALAALLGAPEALLRPALSAMLVIVLELGSVVLVLLVAGPGLRGWREPGELQVAPPPPFVAAALPVQADTAQWRRQRAKSVSNSVQGEGHARQG
jgi:hypothetical protein